VILKVTQAREKERECLYIEIEDASPTK